MAKKKTPKPASPAKPARKARGKPQDNGQAEVAQPPPLVNPVDPLAGLVMVPAGKYDWTWTQRMVRRKVHDGDGKESTEEVKGLVYGNVALVRKDVSRVGRHWELLHWPSGLRVGGNWKTQAIGRLAVEAIAAEANLHLVDYHDLLNEEQLAHFSRVVRRYQDFDGKTRADVEEVRMKDRTSGAWARIIRLLNEEEFQVGSDDLHDLCDDLLKAMEHESRRWFIGTMGGMRREGFRYLLILLREASAAR